MPQTPLVLELSVSLAAPPGRVFTALLDRVQVARWWGPHGVSSSVLRVEPTVGGPYRYATRPPEGDSFHVTGEFLEVERPRRLSYTFRYEEPASGDGETVVSLSLEARGTATELALTQQPFATDERLALHRNGWSDSLER